MKTTAMRDTHPESILIVEAKNNLAAKVSDALARLGYANATVVSTGAEALVAAVERRPDLMIVNVSLYGRLDGLDTAKLIRSLHHIPVICLADDPHTGPVSDLVQVVGNPLDETELLEAIDGIIKRRAPRVIPSRNRAGLSASPAVQALLSVSLRPDGAFSAANTACCEILGRTERELVGAKLSEFVDSDERDSNLEKLRFISEERPHCRLDLRMRSVDITAQFRWICQGIFDEQGELTGYQLFGWKLAGDGALAVEEQPSIDAVMNDRAGDALRANIVLREAMEAHKKVELDLSRDQGRYREMETILERSPALAFLARNDDRWSLEYVTGNVIQFGYAPDDFTSGAVCYKDVLHPSDISAVEKLIESAREDGRDELRYEHRILTKFGEIRWLDLRVFLRRDTFGVITHYEGVALDVTDRKRAEEALEQSEKRYRTLFNSIGDVALVHTPYGAILDVNIAALITLGYDAGELQSMSVRDIQKPLEDETSDALRWRLIGTGHTYYEAFYVSKDGTRIPFEIHARMIQYGGEVAVLSVARDINERKKAEIALQKAHDELELRVRERTEFNRRIISTSPVGISTYTAEGRAELINQAMADIMEETPNELAKQNFRRLQWWRDTGLLRAADTVLTDGGAVKLEVHTETKTGKERWFEARLSRFNSGEKPHLMLLAYDITDRKNAERQIHNLTQALMSAQEMERERISRDLHDNVAQDLSKLKIDLDTLFREFDHIPPELEEKLSRFSKALNSSIQVVRNLSYDLRPPGLECLGPARILYQLCKDFSSEHGLAVDFGSAGVDHVRFDHHKAINLFRVLQEALRNVVKHADANKVKVRVVASYPNILLRIEDDGVGFDVERRLLTALREKRMGLVSMQERVASLSGDISIDSDPGKGTKILVKIPFKEEESGRPKENSDRG